VTLHYTHVRALIDPEQSDPLPDGQQHRPAAIALLPWQARELAFELLELAEHADRQRKRTRR
jgi:hypothetical protein